MTKTAIIQSTTTGKIHLGYEDAAYTFCNYSGQGSRNRNNRVMTDAEVDAAPDSSFCRKCFDRNAREQVARIRAA